jgi:hypothetical protein
VGVLVLVLACALLFVILSAYARHEGAPRWLAAGAGALASPLLPLAWHGVAERRRRKAGTKSALTGADRFFLRIVAVALVTLGPLLALDPGGVWRAVTRQGAWWLDWTDPPAPRSPVSDPRLLDPIPGDAEALVWSRSVEQLGEAVLALGPDAMMVVIKDEPDRLDALRTDDLVFLAQLRGYSGGLDTVRLAPDLMVVVSERWMEQVAGGGARPAALIDRLRAPPGASAVAVWRPKPGGPVPVVEALGWMIDDRLDGRIEMARGIDGDEMRRRLRRFADEVVATVRKGCAEDVGPVIEGVTVGGEGVELRIHATFHQDRLLAYLACVLSPVRDTP